MNHSSTQAGIADKIRIHAFSLLVLVTSLHSHFTFAEDSQPDSQSVALMEKWMAELGSGNDFSSSTLKELQNSDIKLKKKAILEYSNHLLETYSQLGGESREKRYNQFLKTADRLIPQAKICAYFYDCYSKNILNIDGLNVLLQHYNRSKKYANQFSSSKAIESDHLVNELNQMEKENFIGERSFLVHQAGGKHVTPILMRKTSTENQFIILDSLGSGSNSPFEWAEVMEDEIRKSNLLNIRVHKFSINRQNDGRSCPIFSFKDALQNTKTNLFDAINSCSSNSLQIRPDCKYPASYTMDSILPQFMKLAQKVEVVEEYLRDNRGYSEMPVSPTGTLSEVISRYSKATSTNSYARKRAYKYYGVLIGEALGVPESSEHN